MFRLAISHFAKVVDGCLAVLYQTSHFVFPKPR